MLSFANNASELRIFQEARLLMEEKRKLANKEQMKERNPIDYNKAREEQHREQLQQALSDRAFLQMPMTRF